MVARWPEPQEGPILIRAESGRMIPVTETERRDIFLQVIGNDHPLMDLIQRYIKNDPKCRPGTREIVQLAKMMNSQVSFDFPNKVEVLRHFQIQEGQTQERAPPTRIDQPRELGLSGELERLNLVHSIEVKEMQLQVSDLIA